MILILRIKTEKAHCTGCGRFMRYPVGWLEDCKGSICDCGSTSIKNIQKGRPISRRSVHWPRLCKALGINPRSGLSEYQDSGCDETIGFYYDFVRVHKP